MTQPIPIARHKVFLQALQKLRDDIRRRVTLFFYDRPRQPISQPRNKIVFVRWDAKLGDTIVKSWVLREIKKYRPDLQIIVIAPQSFMAMYLNDLGADEVVVSPKKISFADVRRIAQAVGPVQYVVHLSEHLKPKDIYLLSKIDSKYVMGLDDEVECINIKIGALTRGKHFADKVGMLMQHMGISAYDQSYVVPFEQAAQARTDAWWPKGPVIAFNPLGRGNARQLSLLTAQLIIEHMLKVTRADILILIDPSQRLFAQTLKSKASQSHRLLLPPDNPNAQTFNDLFACVRRSQAMVSADTATVHIASGLGKPVFAFYNPKQNELDFSFSNWSPNSPLAVCQLARRSQPQTINAIDLGEFEVLFAGFLNDYAPSLKA